MPEAHWIRLANGSDYITVTIRLQAGTYVLALLSLESRLY